MRTVSEFIDAHVATRRIRPRSLLSTFFGDVVMPNGGRTWVETICTVFENLGINERLVRTTLFRMREDQWVQSSREGRKSYYQLTEEARRQTWLAERLIYHADVLEWDGTWTLVFLVTGDIDREIKREFQQELGWVGFGVVSKGVLAHPGANLDIVGELIDQLGLQGKVICMRCQNIEDLELGLPIDDRKLAALCMPIATVESDYREFIDTYSVLCGENGALAVQGSNMQLLSLRLLMMDEYRRIVLRDPHLPAQLLPACWAGHQAYHLCGTIYRQLVTQTNAEFQQRQIKAAAGETSVIEPSPEPGYQQRFQV